MSGPLVSVIMPCYQCGATVERSVRSVQAQTQADWELIAVDDGSRDETLEVLQILSHREPRMRVVHQENAGVSAARNAGIELARGKWLFFLDADDLLERDCLEKLLSLQDEEAQILCGAYAMRYVDEGGREEIYTCADGDRQCMLESLIRGDSALNSMCARLYSAELIRRANVRAPHGVKVGEDVLFNLEAFSSAAGWRVSRDVVYVYEYGGDSAMTRAKRNRMESSRDMIDGIGEFIQRTNQQTPLFRAHVDIYIRTLRADKGRIGAAFALTYGMVARMTKGVRLKSLPLKQKLYYLALRLLPCTSVLLP